MRNTNTRYWRPGLCSALISGFAAVVSASAAAPGDGSISFDGMIDEWPEGVSAVATDRWVYVRYGIEAPSSIQNGSVMTVLQVDLDQDASTGFAVEGGGLGVDLEFTMTTLDRRDPTRLGGGLEINAYGPNASQESVGHASVGFACLPTHASTAFEIRFARDLDGPPWLESMAQSSDGLRYRFVHRDAMYLDQWAGDVLSLSLPPVTPGRELFDVAIPAKGDGVLRVVSWNVLWGNPSSSPAEYARVLKALGPDVVLFQEWDHGYWTDEDRMPEGEYTGWLDKHLGGGPWSIRRCDERGVLVASRSPVRPFLPENIVVHADRSAGITRDRGVRCASGLIDTPLGVVAAVSVHLKSQGGLGTREDRIREAEATAIHDAIRAGLDGARPDFLIIAGDWNLVGGRGPIERAGTGIDLGGSDLLDVVPRRLGSGDVLTWRDQRSHFAPGRLDYALVADDGVEVVRAFVLDTTLLSDSSLHEARLLRGDTDSSDHLPMVVDLRKQDQE